MKPILDRRVGARALTVALSVFLMSCSDQEIQAPDAAPIFTAQPVDTSAVEPPDTGAEGSNLPDVGGPTLPSGDTTGPTSPVVEPIEGPAIPGLDSDDRFCAAWSRFAGSFQIVTPAWLIATDPAENIDPGQLEASAAQTMVAAYYEMGTTWPEAIADVKDQSLAVYQPMFDRMNRSVGYLRDAGATDDQMLGIAAWWETQLASFDGFVFPEVGQAPADLLPLLEQAGIAVNTNEVPMPEDEALVQSSDPLVDLFDYLAASCPDQGLLSGREVLDDA